MVSAVSNIKRSFNLKFRRSSKESSQPKATILKLPETSQCIVHLKLLRAFARLRVRVVDALLQSPQIQHMLKIGSQSERVSDNDKVREQAWRVYLEHAFPRFEAWWKSMVPKDERGQLCQVDTAVCVQPGKLEAMLRDTKPMVWSEKNLPPLDVIMMLHSFMLNPRCFLEDCIRFGMLPLWKAGMPWHLIGQAVQTSTDEYLVSSPTRKAWKAATGHDWEEDVNHLELALTCPGCSRATKFSPVVQLLDKLSRSTDDSSHEIEKYCMSCNLTFNNDDLQVYKFRRAIEDLQCRDTPMPGTLLSMSGLAQSASGVDEIPQMFALNRLVKGEIGRQILAITSQEKLRHQEWPSIRDIQGLINNALECSGDRHLRVAIRRAISQATDNYSIFALDLPAAIFRQCVFIEKMEEIDWLHSPALQYTIADLIGRYESFFEIMAQNENNVAVPTYAVDLAWHTHQLSPASYYSYSVAHTGNVFIDHDDRIEEGVRTDAFGWTGEQYKQLTNGKDYSQCLCWHCAAAREELDGKSQILVTDDHGHVDIENSPELSNLIRSRIAQSQYTKLEEDFAIACRLSEKQNIPLPNQKQYLESYTWLYPEAIPLVR